MRNKTHRLRRAAALHAALHVVANTAAPAVRISQALAAVVSSAALVGCAGGQTVNGLKVGDVFSDPAVRALAEAAARGDVAGVHRGHAAGVNVNAVGREGMTPLLWAMGARNHEGMRALLELGADPNVRGPKGLHPLTLATGSKDSALLQLLLEHGGDPNAKDGEGDPLLYTAVMESRWENMRLLVQKGADVNALDAGHSTPAMLAATTFEWDAAAYLLEHGADPTIPDLSGATIAYAVDRSSQHADDVNGRAVARVRQLLLARGITFPPPDPQEVRRRVFGTASNP